MRARINSCCPGCGELIRIGNPILLFADDELWICQRCALMRRATKDEPAGRTWADQMYAELGITLADAAHKALAPVLHPDAGGDHDAMSDLNHARDRAHGRNTRERVVA
jgi:hypothetical protein